MQKSERRMKAEKFFFMLMIVLLSASSIAVAGKGTIGILGALDEEIRLLEERILSPQTDTILGIKFIRGKLANQSIVLTKTGVGKVNAAMIATLLIEKYRPNAIIFTGIAGGLNPELHPGDIVLGHQTAQHDYGAITLNGLKNGSARNPIDGIRNPVFFPADSMLIVTAEIAAQHIQLEKIRIGDSNRVPRIIRGTVVTGDVFVSSSQKKAELRETLKADAVEMEGAAVAQICWQLKVPCLVIRSLSDSADEDADMDFERFAKIAAKNSASLVLAMLEHFSSIKIHPND